jgi:hypothetical protein
MLLALERDLSGVMQCATLALTQGSETERAVAVSALYVFDDQKAADLRVELVRLLGWDSSQEHG